jgi:hypothetical protein
MAATGLPLPGMVWLGRRQNQEAHPGTPHLHSTVGSQERKHCFMEITRNPNRAGLQTLNKANCLHLLGLAAFLVFDIDTDVCSIQDFCSTYGRTVTKEGVLDMQEN